MNTKWVRWGAFLSLATGLILQSVGAALYDAESMLRHLAGFFWLVGPCWTWAVGLSAVLNHRGVRAFSGGDSIWFAVLGLNAVRAGVIGGWIEAVIAFSSWGIWFGTYLWISTSPGGSRWIVRGIAGLFVGIGIIMATGGIIEAFSGILIVKKTTIGIDIIRRYGFAQSIVNGGIGIGCGIMFTMYLLVGARAWLPRLLLSTLVGYQLLGLLLTTARGPTLFSLAAMGIVMVTGLARRNSGIQNQTVLLVFGGIALLPIAGRAGWFSTDLIEYIQSSMTLDDFSNTVRIERMLDTIRLVTARADVALFGIGSGETAALSVYRGNETLTSESSALKLWLETGLLGLLSFYAILSSALFRGFRMYGRLGHVASPGGAEPLQQMCILCCLGLLSIESMFHDMMSTWVISGVYWTVFGVLNAANRDAEDLLDAWSKSDVGRRVTVLLPLPAGSGSRLSLQLCDVGGGGLRRRDRK